jgi:SAM-dependent methyltransferase
MPRLKKTYDAEFERNAYDDAYYHNHVKYYEKGLSGFAKFMLENVSFNSLCDLGCGTGAFSATLQDEKEVLGVDFSVGSENVSYLKKENFLLGDLTQPLNLGRKFDVVLSLEVWEHLYRECEQAYLDNIVALDPSTLIISCARPGQWGRHHVNLQSQEEWVPKITSRGYSVSEDLTQKFRAIPRLATFYKKNTVIFCKP